jgi:hypothetical protein
MNVFTPFRIASAISGVSIDAFVTTICCPGGGDKVFWVFPSKPKSALNGRYPLAVSQMG